MNFTLTVKQAPVGNNGLGSKRAKEVVFESPVAGTLTMDQLKALWEVEQTLNNLPGVNLRVHINVAE